MVQQGPLPSEVAFRIGTAARELKGVDVRTLVATLISLTDNQLTLETFERIGPRVLRDALRGQVPTTTSADAHRAVQRLRTASIRFLNEESPSPDGIKAPPREGWLDVAFSSNEGHWLDASLARCRRVLVYRVGPEETRLVDVRQAEALEEGPAWRGRLNLVGDCQVVYTLSVAGPAISALVNARIHTVRVQHAVPCAHVLQRLQGVVRRAPPPWMRKVMSHNASRAAGLMGNSVGAIAAM